MFTNNSKNIFEDYNSFEEFVATKLKSLVDRMILHILLLIFKS